MISFIAAVVVGIIIAILICVALVGMGGIVFLIALALIGAYKFVRSLV